MMTQSIKVSVHDTMYRRYVKTRTEILDAMGTGYYRGTRIQPEEREERIQQLLEELDSEYPGYANLYRERGRKAQRRNAYGMV